jgi:GNAT superfamily N-acetyltransferase
LSKYWKIGLIAWSWFFAAPTGRFYRSSADKKVCSRQNQWGRVMVPPVTQAIDRLSPETLRIVDDFWAADLGCSRAMLRSSRAIAVPHPAKYSDWSGIFILLVGTAPIISLPRALYSSLHTQAQSWLASEALDATFLRSVLGGSVDKIIGPAFIGYTDHRSAPSAEASRARLLREDDGENVAGLRAACDPADWRQGGREHGDNPAVGCFANEELVAMAGYEIWAGAIAQISIVTHPSYRRRGFGRTAVSRLIDIVFERRLVPQYRTLHSNQASMKIASALGFVPYGTTMTVHLRSNS